MAKKAFFVLVISIFSGFSLMALALAEEATTAPAPVEQAADPIIAPAVRSDTQWVWGEVTSVDALANTLTLKYLDYEADQEKSIVLSVDENTAYENINSIGELKEKDVLSVDYVIAEDKNIAKNISLEKLDAVAPETVSAEATVEPAVSAEVSPDQAVLPETAPADSQPVTQADETSAEVPAKAPVAADPLAAAIASEQPAQSPALAVSGAQEAADPAGK
ncbi:MAG: hypothetical protein WC561_02465 [Candidatus Omnitrophota bacterium]